MPHQKSIPTRKTPLQNMFHSSSQYSEEPQSSHSRGGFQNDCFHRSDEAQHYAQNYYDMEYNSRNDEEWRRFCMSQQPHQSSTVDTIGKVKKVGSHESDEEAAATALLIAAGGPRRADVEKQKEMEALKKANGTPVESSPQELDHACHVSVNSMDAQENVPSLPSNNFHNTTEGGSLKSEPSDVPNFPAILHGVLTDSEFSSSVLEWLPNGKSWRVLRWDDLANKVVPVHFPDLDCKKVWGECKKDENTTSDRINRFLQHIQIWGFEEMKEVGPEMGSYQHEFFIRIAPNLCRHMKIEESKNDYSAVTVASSSNDEKNVVSPPRCLPRHLGIEGPSLDSPKSMRHLGQRNSAVVSISPKKRKPQPDTTSQDGKPSSRTSPRFVPFSDYDGCQQTQSKTNVSFRPGSPSYMYNRHRSASNCQPNYVSPSSLGNPRFVGSHNDRSDNRSVRIPDSPFPSTYETTPSRMSRGIPTTPHLQSNRGGAHACRLDRRDETEKRSISSPAASTQRRSFPVSNRGKGYRTNLSRTLPPHSIQESEVTTRTRSNRIVNPDIPTVKMCDGDKDGMEENGNQTAFKRRCQGKTTAD